MPKSLHINTAKITANYIEKMSKTLDEVGYGYYNSVVSQMRTDAGRHGVTVQEKNDNEKLIIQIIGNAFAVIDSWGTGSLMDTSNPALNPYFKSEYYNPARPQRAGAPITGRPEGYYTDIFGEQAYSSGAVEGLNLEQNPDSPIQAQPPSGAFQDSDAWFKAENTLYEAIDKANKDFFKGVFANFKKYSSFY